jgi:mannose-6-phosphate isomerase-like protein (cupin superfamily)
MIIVLAGEGQLNITKQKSLDVEFGKIAFVPPHTEHQMFNSGKINFKYIYVATTSK